MPRNLDRILWYRRKPFYNNAVLRSFEKIADCEAIRPDIAGIMGAFGAALIARERYQDCEGSTMLPIEEIETLEYKTTVTKCRGCTNNCRLTINHFSGGRKFITGNRCERGLGKEKSKIIYQTSSPIKCSAILDTLRFLKKRHPKEPSVCPEF